MNTCSRITRARLFINQSEKCMNKVIFVVVLGVVGAYGWAVVEALRTIYALLQHSPMSLDDKIYAGANSVLAFVYISFLFVQKEEFCNKRRYLSFKLWLLDYIVGCLPSREEDNTSAPRYYDDRVIECPKWNKDG